MSPKFVLILYYLVPFAVLGQTVLTPNPIVESVPFGLKHSPENNVAPGSLYFPAAWNFVYDSWNNAFGQPVYTESLSLTSMIRRDDNKTGASAIGGVIYAGSDDVFAFTHYGRTGKLIWRTSPIANNMMATRWSLANFAIFRRPASPSISDQLR